METLYVDSYPGIKIESCRKHKGTDVSFPMIFEVSQAGMDKNMITIRDITPEYSHDSKGEVIEVTPEHRDSLVLHVEEFKAIAFAVENLIK